MPFTAKNFSVIHFNNVGPTFVVTFHLLTYPSEPALCTCVCIYLAPKASKSKVVIFVRQKNVTTWTKISAQIYEIAQEAVNSFYGMFSS